MKQMRKLSDGYPIGATLALRNDEARYYSSSFPEEALAPYAVIRIQQVAPHIGLSVQGVLPYVVACMQYTTWGDNTERAWGWVHLDPGAKRIIGEELAAMAPKRLGEWIYMAIRQGCCDR